MIVSVSFGVDETSLWIVTIVEADGSLDRLDPLLEAQLATRRAVDYAIVFRIIDRSIGETLQDGPATLIPVEN